MICVVTTTQNNIIIQKPLCTNWALIDNNGGFTWALQNIKIYYKIKIMKHGLWVKHNPTTYLHFLQHFFKQYHLQLKLTYPELTILKHNNHVCYCGH